MAIKVFNDDIVNKFRIVGLEVDPSYSKSYILKVPDTNTQRIQECHILIGHVFCSLIENSFVKKIN